MKKIFRKKISEKFVKVKVKFKVKGQGQPEVGKKEKRQILCLFYYDVIKYDCPAVTYYFRETQSNRLQWLTRRTATSFQTE